MIQESLKLIENIKDPHERIGNLRYLKKRVMQLDHRDTCPLCRQELAFEVNEKDLEEIETRIKELQNIISEIIQKRRKELEKEAMEKKKTKEVLKEKAEIYLKENKSLFSKTYRQYHNQNHQDPLDHVRSIILSKEQKEVWNEAMHIYLDTPSRIDFDFEEELFFEI